MPGDLGNSQRIGGLHWDVGIRGAEKAKADLAGVGAEAEKAGTKGAASLNEVEKSTQGFAKSIRLSIAAVTGMIGSITAATGAALLFYNAGTKIREAFEGAKNSLSDFTDTVTGGAKDRIAAYEKERDALYDVIEAERKRYSAGSPARTQAEKDVAALDKKISALRESINAEDAKKRQAAVAKSQEDFDRKNHELALKQQKERQDQEDKWAQEREEKARSFQEFMLSSTKKLREENDKIAEAASKARQEQEKALAAIREQVRVANSLVNNASTAGSFSSDEVLRELQYISSRVGGGTP